MNSIRIERAENGYVVCMEDPAIIKKNRDSKGPYINPERQFVFDDEDDLIEFITKNLDKIIPEKQDEYATSFDMAVKDEEEEEEGE